MFDRISNWLKNFSKTNLFFFLLILATVFIVYNKSINFELLSLDDRSMIQNNINYISDIKTIPKLFLQGCFYSADIPYYRPLLTLSFAVETILFGFDTKVYHFTNILLFIFALYFAYLFLLRLNINKTILKFFIMLFAVHPIFVSCPSYIAARNDTLLAIFLCASFICFIDHIKFNKRKDMFLFYSCFALSLFTKETSVVLVPLYLFYVLLFDISYLKKKSFYRDIIAIAVIVIVYFIFRNISVNATTTSANIKYFWGNLFYVTSVYLYKIFIPDYVFVYLETVKINYETVAFFPLFIVFLVLLFIKNKPNRKLIIFSAVWFSIMLFPSFVLKRYVILFHRLFIPAFGIIIISSIFVEYLINKYPEIKKYFVILFCIVFVTFSMLSYKYADNYKNSDAFWQAAYEDDSESVIVCKSMASMLLEYGKTEEARGVIAKILQKEPGYIVDEKFIENLIFLGELDLAQSACEDYIDLKGEDEEVNYYLSEISKIREDYDKALAYNKRAEELFGRQTIPMLHQQANIYFLKNDYENSLACYKKLLNYHPERKIYKEKVEEISKLLQSQEK